MRSARLDESVHGLQKLVLRHHKHLLGENDSPVFLISLNEAGEQVPVEDAFAASTTKETLLGGLPTFDPTPGEGYYAHLKRVESRVDRVHGQTTTWEVTGPDWNATVVVRDASSDGALLVSVENANLSVDSSAFLGRFA